MKRFMQLCGVLLLALALFSISAIAIPHMVQPAEKTPVSEPDPTPSPVIQEKRPNYAIIEYGIPEVINNNDGPLFSYIRFPRGGNPTDAAIFEWAHQFNSDRIIEFEHRRENEPGALGEVNIHFNSFLIENKYAGIFQYGEYTYSLAMPTELIVEAFNIDLSAERFLKNSDILDFTQIDSIIAPLLRDRFAIEHPRTNVHLNFIDETWFTKIIIAHEGILVIVERDTFLPGFDTLTLTLPYDELGDALLLNIDSLHDADPVPAPGSDLSDINNGTSNSYIDNIDQTRPIIALSFDDGPGIYTNDFLDLLEEYEIRATFCVIGNLVNTQSEALARAAAMGSEVIGHSWDHKKLAKLTADELTKQLVDTMDAIEAATNTRVPLFRPPYGESNETMKEVAAELGLALIDWSIDPKDWDIMDADEIYDAVIYNVSDGAVILSHEIYESTLEAYKRLIPDLLDLGYQIVTVSELFFIKQGPLVPGRVYYSAN